MSIAENYKQLHVELTELCALAHRNADEVKILAVSKTVGPDKVKTAIEAGFSEFGENRVEGLQEKQSLFPEQTWHFIGNVQSRKIPAIVKHASLIHSVYQASHLASINKAAVQLGKTQKILLEVNTSGEAVKGGVSVGGAEEFLKTSTAYENLQVCGLMTMAPRGSQSIAKECFMRLSDLRDTLQNSATAWAPELVLDELSMGMSEDWQQAVVSGATIIRIGRMIFDETYTQI